MKKKKKGARLSQVKGRLGRVLCWGVAGTARRDPIVPLSRALGRHWASTDPRGVGRTPPARAESRARARGTSTQRSRGSSCAALLFPGWTVQAQGRASIGPELKGAWPHTPPCPRGHAPSPCSILAVEAQQLEESDVSPGKAAGPGTLGKGVVVRGIPGATGMGPRPALLFCSSSVEPYRSPAP